MNTFYGTFIRLKFLLLIDVFLLLWSINIDNRFSSPAIMLAPDRILLLTLARASNASARVLVQLPRAASMKTQSPTLKLIEMIMIVMNIINDTMNWQQSTNKMNLTWNNPTDKICFKKICEIWKIRIPLHGTWKNIIIMTNI